MDRNIDRCTLEQSCLGYFAVLYRGHRACARGDRRGRVRGPHADGAAGRDLREPLPGCARAVLGRQTADAQLADHLRVERAHAASVFDAQVELHDEIVVALAERIRSPGRLLGLALQIVRVRESSDVRKVMSALRGSGV